MKKDDANPQAAAWHQASLDRPEHFPLSMTYRGIRYDGFPADVFREVGRQTEVDAKKVTTRIRFCLPDGLEVTLQAAFYPAYGVSEWTAWFENTTQHNSGILENVTSTLTFSGSRPCERSFWAIPNAYRPYAQDLDDIPVRFVSDSAGRPTSTSVFNLEIRHRRRRMLHRLGRPGRLISSDGNDNLYGRRPTTCAHTETGITSDGVVCPGPYRIRNENAATNFWPAGFACNLQATRRRAIRAPCFPPAAWPPTPPAQLRRQHLRAPHDLAALAGKDAV